MNTEDFLAEFRSPSTRKTYKFALQKFFEFKKTTPSEYFTESKKLQDYKHDLIIFARHLEEQRMTSKSISTYLGGTVSFFSRNDVEMPRRFWKDIKVESYATTNDGVLTREILRSILSYCDIPGRALFLLASSSGMRIEDTLAVTTKQVQEGMKNSPAKITIIQQKIRQKQTVFFSKEASDEINVWLKKREQFLGKGRTRCVFGKHHTKDKNDQRLFPFTYSYALFLWNQALETSGHSKKDEITHRNIYHIHGLRKYFRSQCTVAGVEPNIAELFLG